MRRAAPHGGCVRLGTCLRRCRISCREVMHLRPQTSSSLTTSSCAWAEELDEFSEFGQIKGKKNNPTLFWVQAFSLELMHGQILSGLRLSYSNVGPQIGLCWGKYGDFEDTWGAKKLLYFVWSPPWHLYIFLLATPLAFYLTYLLAYLLAFYLAYLLANLLAFYLAYLLAFYLTYLVAFYLAYLLAFYLAVEVRQCPLGSGARGWGPAVPTAETTKCKYLHFRHLMNL